MSNERPLRLGALFRESRATPTSALKKPPPEQVLSSAVSFPVSSVVSDAESESKAHAGAAGRIEITRSS